MKLKIKFVKEWTDPGDGTVHKIEEVVEFDEAVAKTLISTGYAEEVATTQTVAEELDAALTNLDERVEQAVAGAINKAVGRIETKGGEMRIVAGKAPEEKDPMMGFDDDGDFWRSASRHFFGGGTDERLVPCMKIAKAQPLGKETKDVEMGTGGAILIPPQTSQQIYDRAMGQLDITAKCDRLVLSGYGGIRIPARVDDDRYTATARHGGIVVYKVREAATITASNLQWRMIQLYPEKYAALIAITEEMMASVVNLGSRTTEQMGEAIGDELTEDVMFGRGSPILGAFSSPACVEVAKESGQAADTVQYENIVAMLKAFARKGKPGATWFYNDELFDQLDTMYVAIGTAGFLVMQSTRDSEGKFFNTIKGLPAVATDHCEAPGDAGDICLGYFGDFLFATQGTPQTDMSIHLYFDSARTAFRALIACAGAPKWDKTLRPRKGSTSFRMAPFVKVAARA